MTKSILKIIMYVLIALIPLWGIMLYSASLPLGYIDGEAPNYIWNKEHSNTSDNTYYDVVILGDSVANSAYEPEMLSPTTINLSLGGCTIAETYYIMTDYLYSHQPPKVCYLSFYYSHLNTDECFYKRTLYSHRFSFTQEKELLDNALKYNEDSIISGNYITEWLSYHFYLPNKYMAALLNSKFIGRYSTNIDVINNACIHGGSYIARSNKTNANHEPIVNESYIVGDFFDYYMNQFLKLCYANDITVRIVMVPESPNVTFTDKYTSEMYSYYRPLMEKYSNITFLDRMDGFKYSDFTDKRHLNIDGSLNFSGEIKNIYPNDFKTHRKQSLTYSKGLEEYIKLESSPKSIIERANNTLDCYTIIITHKRGKIIDDISSSPPYTMQLSDYSVANFIGTNCPDNILNELSYNEYNDKYTIHISGIDVPIEVIKKGSDFDLIVVNKTTHSTVCIKYFSTDTNAYKEIL